MAHTLDEEIIRLRTVAALAVPGGDDELEARALLADHLILRAQENADPADAADAVRHIEAVLTGADGTITPDRLLIAVDAALTRQDLGDEADLGLLTDRLTRALTGLPDDAPALVDAALVLGRVTVDLLDEDDPRADPDGAAAQLRRALAGCAPDETAELCYVLGTVLAARFERDADEADRAAAIAATTRAAGALPPPPWLAGALWSLVHLHYGRWEALEAPADLDEAIGTGRRLLTLLETTPGTVPAEIAGTSIFVGYALADRYDRDGREEDRTAAVSLLGRGLRSQERAPEDTLGLGYARYGRLLIGRAADHGSTGDLDLAVAELITARDVLPPGNTGYLDVRLLLCEALIERFQAAPNDADARALVEYGEELRACGDDDVRRDATAIVGMALLARERLQSERVPSLDRPIELLTRALGEMPAGHGLYLGTLMELGAAFVTRGQCAGDHADLREGIRLLTRAYELAPPGHRLRPAVIGALGGSLAAAAQVGAVPEKELDQALALLEEVRGDPVFDLGQRVMLESSVGTVYGYKASAGGGLAVLNQGIAHFAAAEELLPAGHHERIPLLFNFAGMLLTRFQQGGEVRDLDTAIGYLDEAIDYVAASGIDPAGLSPGMEPAVLRGYRAAIVGFRAWRMAETARIAPAVAELTEVVSALPPANGFRPLLYDYLRALRMVGGTRPSTPEAWGRAADEDDALAEEVGGSDSVRALSRLKTAALQMVGAISPYDPDRLNRAIAMLREALETGSLDREIRLRVLLALNVAYFARGREEHDPADFDEALRCGEEVLAELGDSPGHPLAVLIRMGLARLHREHPGGTGRAAVRDLALAGLREHARTVLVQTGAEQALAAARAAADDALEVMGWLLADGAVVDALQALELGRGLVLHAATSAAGVPERLRAAGRADLAASWEEAVADGAGSGSPMGPEQGMVLGRVDFPEALRSQVVRVLTAAGSAGADLVTAPSADEIAEALRRTGTDALVYLVARAHPEAGTAIWVTAAGEVAEQPLPVLFTRPGGPLDAYTSAQRDLRAGPETDEALDRWAEALSGLCDWAGRSAMRRILKRATAGSGGREPRLVLVPVGELGRVPWHAALIRSGGSARYAVQDALISYAASARQFIEVAAREEMPYGSAPVIVADPTGELGGAALEAEVFTRCHPRAAVLGLPAGRKADGPGTPEEVLARLPGPGGPGASILHLACHGNIVPGSPADSYLDLFGGRLAIARILAQAEARPAGSPGGLVLPIACVSGLTDDVHDESLAVGSAFLAAGATGTVSALWDLPDVEAAALMACFHDRLAGGATPAEALRAAQLWALDPGRERIPGMPLELTLAMSGDSLADVAAWAAFTHQGR